MADSVPPTRLIEFPLQGGGSIQVEVDDRTSGPVRVARASGVVERVERTFEDVTAAIRPVARAILERLKDLAPDEVEVEFGVKFTGAAGIVIARASAEGNCNVTLKWKRPVPTA